MVDAPLPEIGGDPEGRRGGARVLEAAGIGDDARIEGGGLLGVRDPAHPPDQLEDQLAGRCGPGVDEVDVAEAEVGCMVVEVDAGARGLEHTQQQVEARVLGAVHREEHLGRRRRVTADEIQAGEEGVLGRHTKLRAPPPHPDPLAQPAQVEADAEHRPEGVAVREDVAGNRDLPGAGEGLDGPVPLLVIDHLRVPPTPG